MPLIPTLAYKTLRLAVAEPEAVFESSGTTDSIPSRHHHCHLDLYRQVIDVTFPPALLAPPLEPAPPMLSLVPSLEDAPRSSLAFMLDHVMRRHAGEKSAVIAGPGGVRGPAARGFLAARQRDGAPVVVLGTTLALGQLAAALERLRLNFRLPAGSRIFETGGAKGRSSTLDRDELRAALHLRLGVGPEAFVREYGMTELTSHFYTTPGGDRFGVPPWVRVRVLDPETLDELPAGRPGLLAVFDLANVGSALHLLTEDLAMRHDDGSFELVGRASGAELRGCSLLSEELATGS